MERSVYQIIESIKADQRKKKQKRKPVSSIDQALESLGVAIRFKEAEKELVK